MKLVIEKIKKIRQDKGISHEYLAHRLGISQAAYSKLEKNQTKLSVERLFKISEVLETSIVKLLNSNLLLKNDSFSSIDYLTEEVFKDLCVESQQKTQKIISLYEARLQDKEDLIAVLRKSNHYLP